MRLAIFGGGMGILVSICGYSVFHHWQAWALLLGASFLHVFTERRAA